MVEVRVLGPVAVVDGDASQPLGGPRQQSVLAVLVALAGETVSTDRLIDEIWGEDPPPAARNSLQSMVSNLRRVLADAPEISIERTGPGYVLLCPDDHIDARVFVTAVDRGRSLLSEDPGQAATILSTALSAWSGEAYAGISDEIPVLQAERIRLEELRLRALGYRLEADLNMGRHGEVIGELDTLVDAHSLHEEFTRLHMVALYRAGRQSDALRAYSRLRRVLGEELGIEPSSDLRELEQRILDQDPALLVAGDPSARRTDLPNPYKGLRAFTEGDAEDFFGRDTLRDEILAEVERAGPGGFVAVVGPSGSGKSSLAAAGVVPAMRHAEPSWLIMTIYPGSHPMEELEAAILRAAPDSAAALVELLERPGGLRRAVRLVAEDDVQVMLLIDQAEELFSTASSNERRRFLDEVAGALSDERPRLRVLMTMRADFLAEGLSDPSFAEILRRRTVLVSPMSPAELEAAIVGPAERVGVAVDTGLVAAAVADVGDHPGALPMLQHALTETFEARTTDVLDRADYEAVGGVGQALANTAAAVLGRLSDEDRALARIVLLRLVTPGDATADTRRRVRFEMLLETGEGEAVTRVVDAFASARLLVLDVDARTGDRTVEVAHEALLQRWPTYREWIDQARDDLRTEQRLRALAADWVANERHDAFLLRGSNLARYVGWRDETSVPLDAPSVAFLDAGIEAETASARITARRRRRVIALLSTATIVSIVLAVFAGILSARSARDARLAEARSLANESGAVIAEDPELALLLALEAADLEPLPEVLEAVHRGVRNQRLVAIFPAEAATAIWLDEDRIATLRDDGMIEVFRVADGASEARIGPVSGPIELDRGGDSPVLAASFDNTFIAAGFADGTMEVWEITSGSLVWSIQVGSSLPTISWHPKLLEVAARSGQPDSFEIFDDPTSTGAVYDGTTGDVLGFFTQCVCPAEIAFDEIGRLWLQGGGGTASNAVMYALQRDESGGVDLVTELRFPGVDEVAADRFLVVAAHGSLAQAQTTEGVVLSAFGQHASLIRDIDLGPRRLVVSGGDDGRARVWSADTGRQHYVLAGHEGVVTGVRFVPGTGGDRVLTTGTDGTARIWDVSVEGPSEIDAVSLPGRGALFSAYIGEGRYVVAASDLDLYPRARLVVLRNLVPAEIDSIGPGDSIPSLSGNPLAVDSESGRLVVSGGLVDPALSFVGGPWPSVDTTLPWGSATALAFDGSALLAGGCGDAEFFDCQGRGFVAQVPLVDGMPAFEDAPALDLGPMVPIAVVPSSPGVVVLAVDDPLSSSSASVTFWRPPGVGVEASWSVAADATALAAGAERVVVGFGSGSLEFYDRSGTLLRSHSAHTGGVAGIAIEQDLELAITAGADGRVRIWDLETGDDSYILFESPGRILSIDVDPEAREVLAAEEGGVVWVLTYDPDRIVEIARERVTRDLTEVECQRYLRRSCDA